MIKYLYIIFIGLLFTTLVAVGIAAFYPEPKYPEYPLELSRPGAEPMIGSKEDAAYQKRQREYEAKTKEYQRVSEIYNRNVSIAALVFAVIFVVLGLVLAKSMPIIPDGLLLGSLGTLIYSIIRGFGANDDIFRFVIVAVSLGISLVIGYAKFIKPQLKK
jgi:hypothetical protein